jgi:hypothetical protein
VLGLLAPTLIALAAARLCGGTVRALLSTRVRGWPAIVAAFGLELALYNPPLDEQEWARAVGPSLWLAARLVFVAVLVWNGWGGSRAAWPWRIAAAGVALNTLVIALNGGHMPQSLDAARAVWGASQIDPARLQNVSTMAADTRLAWLGDVIAEPAWLPRRNVVSIGDLLLAAGVAAWVFCAMRPDLRRATIGSRIGTSDRWSRTTPFAPSEVRRFFASNLWYR